MQLARVCERMRKRHIYDLRSLINHVILSRDAVFAGDKEIGPQSTDEEPPDLVDKFNNDDSSVDSYATMPQLLRWIKSDLDLSSSDYEDIKDDVEDHISFTINSRHQSDDQLEDENSLDEDVLD